MPEGVGYSKDAVTRRLRNQKQKQNPKSNKMLKTLADVSRLRNQTPTVK